MEQPITEIVIQPHVKLGGGVHKGLKGVPGPP